MLAERRDAITVRAWAKLNLCLSVGPPASTPLERRGWHAIASWMHAVDLADTIVLRCAAPGAGATFSRRWGDGSASAVAWPLEKDLAFRALRLVEEEVGEQLDVAVDIEKRIPAGGGLGGGSSDAATVLMGLDSLLGLGLGIHRLAEIGARLGSDVRFFLDSEVPPRPGVVTGFGDRVERQERWGGWVLLIFPEFGCSTPEVYRAYDRIGPRPLREEAVRAVAAGGVVTTGSLFNDLAAAAAAVEPRLASLMRAVGEALGTLIHVTGSGSTLFAVAEGGEAQARAWKRALASAGSIRSLAVRLV